MTLNFTVPPNFSGLNVVAIGGGTGLSTLLRGLKHFVKHPDDEGEVTHPIAKLTGIVTVSDDGGSSGRLRKEFGVIPPGDIRNCMTALSEDEALMSKLFQYRFATGEGLEGHNFGNLFLMALAEVTGDFTAAVKFSSAILKTRGDIFPSTTANVQLDAHMHDGSRVRGETSITASKKRILRLRLVPANVQPLPQTLKAIAEADLITIGPGSLFTSLIPNLLVRSIPQAIERSSAVKAYVCNLMTQANESLDLTASDHIRALFEHAGRKVFDYALLNDAPISAELRAKYAAENSEPIVHDVDAVRALGVEPILGPHLDSSGMARHDSLRVAEDLLNLVMNVRYGTQGKMMANAIRQ